MAIRTDLALESRELLVEELPGIKSEQSRVGDATVTRIYVTDEQGSRALGKPQGCYVTVEVPPLTADSGMDEQLVNTLSSEMAALLPEGHVLVVGLGNTRITPDALGPRAAARVLATRHITGQRVQDVGLGELRPVSVIAPGVLGQTGIETGEIIAGIAERVGPAAVVVIDALASRRLSRLGCTVQLADSGISPGSGVGNRRSPIGREQLGVPVISVGVPTVVDALTLAEDLTGREPDDVDMQQGGMIVTPQEVDMLIERASHLIAHALNCALHPQLDSDLLLGVV
jgi:spore protease